MVFRKTLVSGIIRMAVCAAMLIGLPLVGISTNTSDIGPYLEFPPITRYVAHAPFNAAVFVFIAFLDVMMLLGIAILLGSSKNNRPMIKTPNRRTFPVWGWWGLLIMIVGWVLAWTRISWFEPLQEHTFCIPWVGYILSVNALCVRRSGSSLITDAFGRFMAMFAVSIIFWWFFEYLNRFVQNWYYVQVGDFGPLGYALLASMAFATVLPAVLSTQRLLLTFGIFNPGLSKLRSVDVPHGYAPAVIVLLTAGGGLTLIGVYPDYLYPLVWFAPLLIICGLQALVSRPTVFTDLKNGDWRLAITSAAAALVCGFFWEMWNYYSFTRWEYVIPFVDRFHIFAMPLLGYGGYLPFGLECLAVGLLVMPREYILPDTPTWQDERM